MTLWNRFEEDKSYIEKKFRNPDYSHSSGLPTDALKEALEQLADSSIGVPHVTTKAQAFDFVLRNVRIDTRPYDWFIGMEEWGKKTLENVFLPRWREEALTGIDEETKHFLFDVLCKNQVLSLGVDFSHSVPDWDAVLQLGFPGILARARRYHEERAATGSMTEEQHNFFLGIEREYESVIEFLARLEADARAQQDDSGRCAQLADCLHRLQIGAPQNLYDALQIIWLYFLFSEQVDALQARSLGNLDRVLDPYYQRDLANGTFTEAQVRELFRYFLYQFSAMRYFWGHPFYFGGTNADGTSAINPLSYLILDEYDRMGIYDPKLQIKVAPNTPTEFLDKALEMIRGGHNSIVFVGEPAIRAGMLARGYTEEEARLSDIKGCYEYAVRGNGVSTVNLILNLPKCLELLLHRGIDPISGARITEDHGDLSQFSDFESFFRALCDTVLELFRQSRTFIDFVDARMAEINPCSMFSGTIERSLQQAFDAYGGGARRHTSDIWFSGPATTADSLTMIQKYVYDRQEFSLCELIAMLDANWENHEDVHIRLLADKDKYGNNRPLPDAMMKRLVETLADSINGIPSTRGGQYVTSLHASNHYTHFGRSTGATPNGRYRGDDCSKNATATLGANHAGATALIESVLKLDSTKFTADLPVDVALHPTAVSGAEGLLAMRALVLSFIKRGGHAIHFNVFDGKTLRAAQEDPEKYKDLQIRVTGWNVLFRNLTREEQDQYILQAEAFA